VNVTDNDFWTPLHAAATCANLDICKILIESGADLLAVNTDGNMPYDICDDEVCLEFIESEMAARGITQQTIDFKRSETELKMLNDLKQICFKQIAHVISYGKSGELTANGGNNNSTTNGKLTKNNSIVAITHFLACFNNPITSDSKLDLNAKDHNGATLVSQIKKKFILYLGFIDYFFPLEIK
jgi:ankyrin repeat protein